ncbi:MAG: hypothetical protein K0R26_5 [Bacteroidota bacterium]|jgi:hypothetical protein|nr:hypothetical protein [Bacteroidota bacterium]
MTILLLKTRIIYLMKIIFFLFLNLLGIAYAQTYEYLDINQVKARVNSGGDLHWDPATGNPGYECPKGSNRNWGGTASLWLGGLDAGGQLHLSAQTYHQSGVDYWPGPLTTNGATTNSTTVGQYNRVWKINKSEIDTFLINIANGNVQNGTYTIPNSILNWPGNGDVTQNQDLILAPFADVNGDQYYDPSSGDYPLIKGDQAIFTIYNDVYLPHGSGGDAFGVEVHLMAYAYGPCSITTGNSFLNYTTFYNYKIINRSSFSYIIYSALFNDSYFGVTEYVGCDVMDDYGYNYNNSSTKNPAIGVAILRSPYNTNNGIDDDDDGIIDELFEEIGMTNFMYYNNSFPGIPLSQSDPITANDYYQYLRSSWKDGTPLTCGANGYGGSVATNFAYPGNSQTTGPCVPGNWAENGTGSDKRFVMSSGDFTLFPGSITELEYAYITAFDSITNDPLGKLDSDVQNLHAIYNTTLNQCMNTDLKESYSQTNIILSPNPTKGILNIKSDLKKNFKIEVIDVFGKVLLSEECKNFDTSLNVTSLPQGIYFLKLISENINTTRKFIKE